MYTEAITSNRRVRKANLGGAFMAEEKKTYTFRCTVCGYEVTVDTPELPEDFVCPVCGVGADMFELVEE
jgi:rubredoxin